MIECKLAQNVPQRALCAFAERFPQAEAVQIVRDLRQEERRNAVRITAAAQWLHSLDA